MEQLRLIEPAKPLTLDGFTPPLSLEETQMGFETYDVQPYDPYADEKPPTETHYRLRIKDAVIEGGHLRGGWITSVADALRTWLRDASNERKSPQAWQYITQNVAAINTSLRYWKAVDTYKNLDHAEARIKRELHEIHRARLHQQIAIRQVLDGRSYTPDEERLAWAELTDLPFDANDDEVLWNGRY